MNLGVQEREMDNPYLPPGFREFTLSCTALLGSGGASALLEFRDSVSNPISTRGDELRPPHETVSSNMIYFISHKELKFTSNEKAIVILDRACNKTVCKRYGYQHKKNIEYNVDYSQGS